MKIFRNPPLVMSGLTLGLFALGNLLKLYHPSLRHLLSIIALLLYLFLILSILKNLSQALEQIKHPLIASIFPTFFMSGMLLAGYIQTFPFLEDWVTLISLTIWWLALLGNAGLIAYFTIKFVIPFHWEHVFPSWSVLYVGIAVATLTAPISGQYILGQIIFWTCLLLTLLILPLMTIKAYCIGLPVTAKPNICTFCAPLSLLLAGYLKTFSPEQSPNTNFVWLLLLASQLLYFFVVLQLPVLLKREFNPGFSAFTFPFAISATALHSAGSYLHLQQPLFQLLVKLEELLASILVLFILYSYLRFLSKQEDLPSN